MQKVTVMIVFALWGTGLLNVRSAEKDGEFRVPAKTTAEALKSFDTVGGFEMQLVAAEPASDSADGRRL